MKMSFDGTGFASNSAKKTARAIAPSAPIVPPYLLLARFCFCTRVYSTQLQSYNPPQLSSAHRCAGTVFNMESLKTSINLLQNHGRYSQDGTKKRSFWDQATFKVFQVFIWMFRRRWKLRIPLLNRSKQLVLVSFTAGLPIPTSLSSTKRNCWKTWGKWLITH